MAEQALMLPDGLKKLLRRRGFAFTQNPGAAALQPRPGVKTVGISGHLALLLRGRFCNVKPDVEKLPPVCSVLPKNFERGEGGKC